MSAVAPVSDVSLKKPSKEVAGQPQTQAVTETKEASTSANASAGLNLNVFGAIAGAFQGKSNKETAADGSSTEQSEGQAKVKGIQVFAFPGKIEPRDTDQTMTGAGEGNMNMLAQGGVEENVRHSKTAMQQK